MDDELNDQRTVRFLIFGLVGGLVGAALPFWLAMSIFRSMEAARQANPGTALCGNPAIAAVLALFIVCPVLGLVTGVFSACLGALTARKAV